MTRLGLEDGVDKVGVAMRKADTAAVNADTSPAPRIPILCFKDVCDGLGSSGIDIAVDDIKSWSRRTAKHLGGENKKTSLASGCLPTCFLDCVHEKSLRSQAF